MVQRPRRTRQRTCSGVSPARTAWAKVIRPNWRRATVAQPGSALHSVVEVFVMPLKPADGV